MRINAPRTRVLAVALLAVTLYVSGTVATRNGSIGTAGTGAADRYGGQRRTAGTTAAPLGSLNEQLSRLANVTPGELDGVLELAPNTCQRDFIDLRTLATWTTTADPCVACQIRPPRCVVFGRSEPALSPTILPPLAHEPASVRAIRVPRGWLLWGVAPGGIVFCSRHDRESARLRHDQRGDTRLRSCPIAETDTGRLLFLDAHRRKITDDAGRRLATTRAAVQPGVPVSTIGDRLALVGSELYRGDRRLWSLREPTGSVISSDRLGRIVLIADGTATHLTIVRGRVTHHVAIALSTRGGAVAPDGSHILLQHGPRLLIELDSSLRPARRLVLARAADLLDWYPNSPQATESRPGTRQSLAGSAPSPLNPTVGSRIAWSAYQAARLGRPR
jgi:hypothetical protein